MFRYAFHAVILSFILNGCNPSGSQSGETDFISAPDNPSTVAEVGEVVYALKIPTDIVSFFEETGTGFDPGITCPLEKIPMYDNPEHMALLLGVLGVDLSYCTLFERVTETAECYHHIELLAGKLELPREIFEDSPGEQRAYLENPDSLKNQIFEIYTEMDNQFRENNQLSLASLSLLGGWLETMYIGVKIYKDKTVMEMGDRILQQKYSLNSLSGILSNQQESLMIRRYMHTVNKLKEVYNKVEIHYETDGFEMDSGQQVFHATLSEIIYEPESLEEICRIILQLREDILPLVHH
ncbi:MAG: hypothetical protein KAS82_07950 [Bacteroidales bacterium]|nr:hypothetical protein [Bacteroidales bacterium]